MLNTKTLAELEQAQNDIISKFNCTLQGGIHDDYVNLEDGLPWMEIGGRFTKESAQEFAQELADTMNVRVLMNRLECWFGDEDVLMLVLDIDPDQENLKKPMGPYSTTESRKKHMEEYGVEILPVTKTQKNKIK